MKKLIAVVAAASLLTGAACALGRATASDTARALPANVAVNVNVTNNYALPMEIYATGSGITHRLGLVYPGMPGSFVLPQAILASGRQVEFLARPSGYGPIVRSGEFTLVPGDAVDFVIMTNLIGTHAEVRM